MQGLAESLCFAVCVCPFLPRIASIWSLETTQSCSLALTNFAFTRGIVAMSANWFSVSVGFNSISRGSINSANPATEIRCVLFMCLSLAQNPDFKTVTATLLSSRNWETTLVERTLSKWPKGGNPYFLSTNRAIALHKFAIDGIYWKLFLFPCNGLKSSSASNLTARVRPLRWGTKNVWKLTPISCRHKRNTRETC